MDRPSESSEHSVGELVTQASEQISRLVRDELRLAQAEMVEKGKRAGTGAGLFGGAGAVAFLAAQALTAAAIAALSLVLQIWAAALIVAGVLLVVAAILAYTGKGQTGKAFPPMPEEAIRSGKADVEEIKERAKPE